MSDAQDLDEKAPDGLVVRKTTVRGEPAVEILLETHGTLWLLAFGTLVIGILLVASSGMASGTLLSFGIGLIGFGVAFVFTAMRVERSAQSIVTTARQLTVGVKKKRQIDVAKIERFAIRPGGGPGRFEVVARIDGADTPIGVFPSAAHASHVEASLAKALGLDEEPRSS